MIKNASKETECTIRRLEDIISLHEGMKNHYFFPSPSTSKQRRKYDDDNSLTTEFVYNGDKYKVVQSTYCSANYVYYNVRYYRNDILQPKMTIRNIKKIYNDLIER